jgi:hypothetical protein
MNAQLPITLFLTTLPFSILQASPTRLSLTLAPNTLEGGSTRASLYSGVSPPNSCSLLVCKEEEK